ncbi:uncharacterized protein EKO05_0008000 [Ascochyta rabiei]|uniref:uncharacterized protein n=1 Tax=Didymella rabiei TaxID=5454 RepID=UPI0022070E96|nr:uncharacterized protein EKO05_0008000 [Ascochyta rabiei]UPX17659.1 hypothetical protein EKO05_0008000 [Ascochyta rabiei]
MYLRCSGGVAGEEAEGDLANISGPPSDQETDENATSTSEAGMTSDSRKGFKAAHQSHDFGEDKLEVLRSGNESHVEDEETNSFMASERPTDGSASSKKSARSLISHETGKQQQEQEDCGISLSHGHVVAMARSSTGTGSSMDTADREIASKVERIKQRLREIPMAQKEPADSILLATAEEPLGAGASSSSLAISATPQRLFKLRKNFDVSRNREGSNWFRSPRGSKTLPRNFVTPEGLQSLASSSTANMESSEDCPHAMHYTSFGDRASVSRSASLRMRNSRLPPAYIQPAELDPIKADDRVPDSRRLGDHSAGDPQDSASPIDLAETASSTPERDSVIYARTLPETVIFDEW